MRFFNVNCTTTKNGTEIAPNFIVNRNVDLMSRGKSFYAVWNPITNMWTTDEYTVYNMIDEALEEKANSLREEGIIHINEKRMQDYNSLSLKMFNQYVQALPDNYHELDSKIVYKDQEVKKEDYCSKRLSYNPEPGACDSWDELISTLYSKEERLKIEWAIGAVASNDICSSQKFLVLYGQAGTGKSTVLNIIEKLFKPYCETFNASSLTSGKDQFSTSQFKSNPLVAIQHDTDLSRIADNSILNSIVAHEPIIVNEKYKAGYTIVPKCMIFLGTNSAVKITDSKSGLIRRLIDVQPSGNKVPPRRYEQLLKRINFELPQIAFHCMEVYKQMGPNYYARYKPLEMMYATDFFFNFVSDNADEFRDFVSLKRAFQTFNEYCNDNNMNIQMAKHRFKVEMLPYFNEFRPYIMIDGQRHTNVFVTLNNSMLNREYGEINEETETAIVLDKTESIFDKRYSECVAQYATEDGKPIKPWDEVETKLKDLDTRKIHYVRLPENHIVIDFDLKDEEGNKDYNKNIREASKWPKTYTEVSKGGSGLHLHYIYNGDVTRLSRVYSENVEIKVFTGKSSLRRKVTRCNDLEVSTISDGVLPLKGDKMVNFEGVKDEKHLRNLIKKNLRKEIHPGTKPSVDLIYSTLEDTYKSGMIYDVNDLYSKVLSFAANSTNHKEYCVGLVEKMKFKSDSERSQIPQYSEDDLVFFDCEIFPNLFIVCFKKQGKDKPVYRLINPEPKDIENLIKMNLIGFNCRRYDNHILYARYIGYSIHQLFELSQKIVNGSSSGCMFGEAYNLSYTDVYDFSNTKMSLKKWEIELGIHHQENQVPWDQDVPKKLWDTIAEYCCNDVIATEAVFDHLKADWSARKILSKLSGLSYNDTTNNHTSRIIFGNDKNYKKEFVYTDLSKEFPGYKFENGHSTYMDEEPSEGGYVFSKPGIYYNVWLLDIQSMHPKSLEMLNLFGKYTKNFTDIRDGRIAVKNEDMEALSTLLGGILLPFAEEAMSGSDVFTMDDLAYALKIAINMVYGETSAKFDNPFKDPRNIDNIVAKRGALFMITLKHECIKHGWNVIHIKTDSIKVEDPTEECINFIMEFGKKYGYIFEHEAIYDRMCLVNDAVYIAKIKWHKKEKKIGKWSATGTQFQVPYVFKTLFSKEKIEFEDMCETKSVKTAIYLKDPNSEDARFIGKVGQFTPVVDGCGGRELVRISNEGKFSAVTGSKGYLWMESLAVKTLNLQNYIDLSFYKRLVDKAVESISAYGDFEFFVSDALEPLPFEEDTIYNQNGIPFL